MTVTKRIVFFGKQKSRLLAEKPTCIVRRGPNKNEEKEVDSFPTEQPPNLIDPRPAAIQPSLNRRNAIKTGVSLATMSALSTVAIPNVHAGEKNTVQLALIGCGGRGNGAVVDVLSIANAESDIGPVKLVAMADLFQAKMTASELALKH